MHQWALLKLRGWVAYHTPDEDGWVCLSPATQLTHFSGCQGASVLFFWHWKQTGGFHTLRGSSCRGESRSGWRETLLPHCHLTARLSSCSPGWHWWMDGLRRSWKSSVIEQTEKAGSTGLDDGADVRRSQTHCIVIERVTKRNKVP